MSAGSKTAAMVQQRKNDSSAKRRAVLATIQAMKATNTPITVAEIARRAHVSPWLVRQQPLLEHLRKAQACQLAGAQGGEIPANSTAGSLLVERDLLRKENQRLRHDLQNHRRRISELLGDQIDGTDAQSQSVRVQELTDQNSILAGQAGDALQQVHHLRQKTDELASDLAAAHRVNRSLMAELNRTKGHLPSQS
ncbi:hypothetical protein FHJ30_17610 [Arthrobacter sp. BB-1]|uniref:hypothetical protein n=2 Tax=Micrococcaceae TaxID=1268 RepID=UPI0010D7C628|nr:MULTISPECIES: hypothetical protein [unclassified Arthrobacter]TNB69760.1 hypothetical protein FHJ30_17610 [Arthrobacter sp. BB-1]VII97925.1 hypothetical protein [Arthrobacter sp. DR-2P]